MKTSKNGKDLANFHDSVKLAQESKSWLAKPQCNA